ncbi:MucB/RseB C-terminal domain-containing protein [Exilibacterium tricleocarpae]|uniref:MucB/RseB C-terminal domain-containing protein n=1 Tax=Exilibacterium tricleocarpae TaxID=2591008 RepID=UPI0015D1DC79|nr:MucB/RseB C-terminal domain-containing protein [Exilibacterium tricleocarpae]
MSRLATVLIVFLPAFTPPSAAQQSGAVQSPAQVTELLGRMSAAVRELDYRGLFTYEQGGSLDTLKIVHSVRDGVEYERLEHLSGPTREFVRRGQPVNCLPPGDQLLRGRLRALGENAGGLSAHYVFYLRGEERIAGREAHILQIVPRDEYRYGYTLGIDRQSGMPLLFMLVSEMEKGKRVLERFQFVELTLGGIDDSELTPVSDRHRIAGQQMDGCRPPPSARTDNWQLNWLPQGFMFSGQRKIEPNGDMLMYTDGLTTFSVFIDPVVDSYTVEGQARRGATVAYMQRVEKHNLPYSITVVGEIPPITARRVAESVKSLVPPPQR